jgi:hypothetical protein
VAGVGSEGVDVIRGTGTPDDCDPRVARKVAEQPPIKRRRRRIKTSGMRRFAFILWIGWITRTP